MAHSELSLQPPINLWFFYVKKLNQSIIYSCDKKSWVIHKHVDWCVVGWMRKDIFVEARLPRLAQFDQINQVLAQNTTGCVLLNGRRLRCFSRAYEWLPSQSCALATDNSP